MPPLCFSFAEQIKKKLNGFVPETILILGSGLGALADALQNPIKIPYESIKGFPKSTVSGHEGQFVAGKLCAKNVLCMQGRFHLYEGIDPQVINQVVTSFKLLGAKRLLATNAAGSLNPKIPAGSLMLITDHINLSFHNPLIGPNDDETGGRFPDMSQAYCLKLADLARLSAKDLDIPLHEGTYLMVSGPNFETPAEVRAFRILGADAVGMSTVPEVLSAARCGLSVLAFSVITNMGTGLQKKLQTHEETLSMAQKASGDLTKLITKIFERI